MSELSHLEPFVIQIDAKEWADRWAENAHKICFDEMRPSHFNRIDYALIIVNGKNKPAGFCTVKELDHESVYWQYGGAFPDTQGTVWTFRCYEMLLDWTFNKYKRITTYVHNENIVYLKMIMKFGFRIIGVRFFAGKIYVELLNERKGE